MKLIIQIPAYNESETLGIALNALPRQIPGVDKVEVLVINDGSTDNTTDVAYANGADHVLVIKQNRGLANAFRNGLQYSLQAGADIIVNTDADNQYQADDIPKLIEPILKNQVEIVIGERPIKSISDFSFTKKMLQRLGSWVVRRVSSSSIPDAPSGFRAYSREAALKLNVFSDYTYTLETIVQAGQQGIPMCSVPVRVNGYLRPSRLLKSIPSYIRYSILTLMRIFNTYKPMAFFFKLGCIPLVIGTILGLRWLFWFSDERASHLPSLILAAVCILMGFQLMIFGLMADLISVNRKLLEDVQYRVRRLQLKKTNKPTIKE